VGELSESLEDYLEIILQLQQEKRVARVRDIAARKGVSNASVSNALHRLARDGFVNHQAHEFVELTDLGLDLARRILRRHAFLVSFLCDVLQVSQEGAERDACSLEHHLSSETLEALSSFYQFVCSCPRVGVNFLESYKACCTRKEDLGNPDVVQLGCVNATLAEGQTWPEKCAAGGTEEELLPLSQLGPGHAGVIVRFKAPSAIRKRLVDAGLLPNVVVEVRRSGPDQRDVQLSVQGCEMVMEAEDAAAVLVRPVSVDDLTV
jgi:DtxR family Mn-dependent transcriptional regulator